MLNRFIKTYGIAILIAILFSACSQDGGDSSFSGEYVDMEIGKSVIIKSGDQLTPMTDDTEIKVEHILEDNVKRVTLLKGRATLLYGEFNATNEVVQ